MNNPIENIKKYVRAANYLTVTQIYLQDNFLLERDLSADDIKPRLFGHWGTCPGINFVYGHLQFFVKKHKQSTIFVLGPGHGMPGLQANLFLDGTLEKYYPKATRTTSGIGYISKHFAWPYGFSSHSSPETPGLILEGGELGYSLSTAYGAILDNPDLLAVCMIGDGEAETGPIAAAWHINKLIDPISNGAVLPILHLNRLKISGPTVFGRMSKAELSALFTGYGYKPFFVTFSQDMHQKMYKTLEACYALIKKIKKNPPKDCARFPMIILDTPKGWTTIKEVRGKKIEGTINSHQVVMPNLRHDNVELHALQEWLLSYKFGELFSENAGFSDDIKSIMPDKNLLIGNNPHVFGANYQSLVLPNAKDLQKPMDQPGFLQSNSMRMAGTYLAQVFSLNAKKKNFRLFSPDETYSNRLDEVFTVTSRGFAWPIEPDDQHMTPQGRVLEMLSEHNMHGLAQGYVLTGRHAVFTTYEAFAQIFSSMSHMYIKFLKYVRKIPWRHTISSLNFLLTSTCWRQEHNGYSHQNPSFISGMLDKQNCFVKVYFPVDDNSTLAVMEEMLSSSEQVNILVAGKTPELRFVSYQQAKSVLKDGIAVWDFASDDNPDIVVAGIGDYVTKEALAGVDFVKRELPEVKIRFVNILRLSANCACENTYHPQISNAVEYFTKDKPVIVNFHGYPEIMKSILFSVENPQRFIIRGYQEQGGTTTPFDMHIRNKTSRYHIVLSILEQARKTGCINIQDSERLFKKYADLIHNHTAYIKAHGADPEEIENWQWKKSAGMLPVVEKNNHANIFINAKTIAIIGLSDTPERPSYGVGKYFQSKGFRIIPVNPNIKESLGEKAYPNLLSIPRDIHIEIVDIFRKPEEVVSHLKEVLTRGGIRTVWLQEGVGSQESEEFAQDFGITLITNFCIMKAHKSL